MVTLSNLGKANYFKTRDLKSGHHQIELAQGNIEKPEFSVNNRKYEISWLPFLTNVGVNIFLFDAGDISHVIAR